MWLNGWMIRMPLGTEVGFNPGDIVLDGDPAPPFVEDPNFEGVDGRFQP